MDPLHGEQRYKRVLCRFVIEMPVSVPVDWDKEAVEFRYNEGTWCASNLPDMLLEAFPPNKERWGHPSNVPEDWDKEPGCFCEQCTCEYIRELPDA